MVHRAELFDLILPIVQSIESYFRSHVANQYTGKCHECAGISDGDYEGVQAVTLTVCSVELGEHQGMCGCLT